MRIWEQNELGCAHVEDAVRRYLNGIEGPHFPRSQALAIYCRDAFTQHMPGNVCLGVLSSVPRGLCTENSPSLAADVTLEMRHMHVIDELGLGLSWDLSLERAVRMSRHLMEG